MKYHILAAILLLTLLICDGLASEKPVNTVRFYMYITNFIKAIFL